jgi:glucokinase
LEFDEWLGVSETVIAVDVGGTTIKGVVVDRGGRFVRELSRATPAGRGPEAVIAELQAVIAELRAAEPETGAVNAVGVVVPGFVDATAGVARFSANLGFRDVPVRQLVAEATGLPTVLEHDVRAAGVAEETVGLTAETDDYLLAVIGTGIAAVVGGNGRSIRGATELAGELGHIPVWPDGESCPCGQRGCLERYASAASVSRRYTELSGSELRAEKVVARRDQDSAAAQVWQDATEALALAFATCTMLLDPAVIVLSGGLSQAGAALVDPLRAALAKRIVWRQPPPVLLSQLGDRGGRIGAAVLTWRSLGLDDFAAWRNWYSPI